jgi:hypothetical protein
MQCFCSSGTKKPEDPNNIQSVNRNESKDDSKSHQSDTGKFIKTAFGKGNPNQGNPKNNNYDSGKGQMFGKTSDATNETPKVKFTEKTINKEKERSETSKSGIKTFNFAATSDSSQ